MSEDTPPKAAGPRPELRREVSRRSLLTDELGRAGRRAARQLPALGGLLGFAFKESETDRDARLVTCLWQLLMGREPKAEERGAGLEVVRNARTPEEKADALVDVLWALGQTTDFEQLGRPDAVLVRGLYRLALEREPSDEERDRALALLAEAREPGARVACLEGLFTGLLRSGESVLRRAPGGSPGR